MNTPFTIDQIPRRTVRHQERDYLFFSGTAYLGIQQNPEFGQLLLEATAQHGTAYGSSRNGNVQLAIYDDAETKLATWMGTEAALTVSSGMLAGQVVVQHLRAQNAGFIYGPNVHPALWHDPTATLPTTSFTDWIAQLPSQLTSLPPGPIAILVNSVDAVRSIYYDFTWVANLPANRDITLVVDDSHGLGLLRAGTGIWPGIPDNPGVNKVVTGSLGKAMGLPGGVIFGSKIFLDGLRQTAFFGACSPIAPAYLAAYGRAGAHYEQAREQLGENVKLAHALLSKTALFTHASGYPVFYTDHNELYPFLLERGMLVYSATYPTPADSANTRIVVSAFHTFDDIQQLASAVYDYVF